MSRRDPAVGCWFRRFASCDRRGSSRIVASRPFGVVIAPGFVSERRSRQIHSLVARHGVVGIGHIISTGGPSYVKSRKAPRVRRPLRPRRSSVPRCWIVTLMHDRSVARPTVVTVYGRRTARRPGHLRPRQIRVPRRCGPAVPAAVACEGTRRHPGGGLLPRRPLSRTRSG